MGEYFKDYFTQIFADKNTDGRGKKICVNRREINQRKSARENRWVHAEGRRLETQMAQKKISVDLRERKRWVHADVRRC
jgi:hypothetical protein